MSRVSKISKFEESARRRRRHDRYYGPTSYSLRYNERWTDDEDDEVIAKSYKITDREIAANLHRSIKSVEHRRRLLKRKGLMSTT